MHTVRKFSKWIIGFYLVAFVVQEVFVLTGLLPPSPSWIPLRHLPPFDLADRMRSAD